MEIKVITRNSIHAKCSHDSGIHGQYLLYNKSKTRGIKIFYSGMYTLSEARSCHAMGLAKREFECLQVASKAKLAPKPYKIVIVKEGRGADVSYSPAVIMRHVKGETHSEAGGEYNDIELRTLAAKLKKLGITHGDMHGDNAIYVDKSKKKLLAIDFAMAHIKKPKAKKKAKRNGPAERRDELEELREDNAYLRNRVDSLEGRLESASIENDQLTADLLEMSDYVKDLETSLAEAYLMSKEDGPAQKTEHKETI